MQYRIDLLISLISYNNNNNQIKSSSKSIENIEEAIVSIPNHNLKLKDFEKMKLLHF